MKYLGGKNNGKEYPKIQTVFKRDPETNFKTLLMWDYSEPEFKYLLKNDWFFTEKIDGTNIRVIWNHETEIVHFKGRTERAQIPTRLLTALQDTFPVEKFKKTFSDTTVTFYGEGYGVGIQKVGKKYLADGNGFILFDVLINDWWLERQNVVKIANTFSVEPVPCLMVGTIPRAVQIAIEGFKSQIGDCVAEGLVLRPITDLYNRMGKRIITKIKHKDFN